MYGWQTRAKPGAALQTPPSLIHSFIHPLVLTALQRRHAQMVKDSLSSYKIDYVIVIKNFLNPEGHQNRITGSKVTGILLKGWILPISIGGVASGRVRACSLRRRLVSNACPKGCGQLLHEGCLAPALGLQGSGLGNKLDL